MDKYYYTYEEFLDDVLELAKKVEDYNPDTLLAVARGGLTLGHFMAQAIDTRRLFVTNSVHYEKSQKLDTIEIFNIPDLSDAKNVLIIDDIIDSGDTLNALLNMLKERYPHVQFKLATIFYKPDALVQADFTLKEAHEWIDFFWEKDLLFN